MQPTPDDLARSAEADLAVCNAATSGPWFVHEQTGKICHGDPTDDRENYPVDCPEDYELMATVRTALPAWIRRAEHERQRAERAESRVKELLAELDYLEENEL